MVKLDVAQAGSQLADLVARAAQGERVVLEQGGQPVAVLVGDEILAKLLEDFEDAEDLADALEAKAEGDREGYVPWEVVKARLDEKFSARSAKAGD